LWRREAPTHPLPLVEGAGARAAACSCVLVSGAALSDGPVQVLISVCYVLPQALNWVLTLLVVLRVIVLYAKVLFNKLVRALVGSSRWARSVSPHGSGLVRRRGWRGSTVLHFIFWLSRWPCLALALRKRSLIRTRCVRLRMLFTLISLKMRLGLPSLLK